MKLRLKTLTALSFAFAAALSIGAHALAAKMSPHSAKASQFTMVALTTKVMPDASLGAADSTASKGAVSSDRKTITFKQKTVRLVVHTGPSSDMLSYRINGLRNPTIVVRHGAKLKILFMNNDDDMFHNIRFGTQPTNFKASASWLTANSVGTVPLPHIDQKSLHAVEMDIAVPASPGKYAYFCTVRGHAPGGMHGAIVVR
jgi:rusticyanin